MIQGLRWQLSLPRLLSCTQTAPLTTHQSGTQSVQCTGIEPPFFIPPLPRPHADTVCTQRFKRVPCHSRHPPFPRPLPWCSLSLPCLRARCIIYLLALNGKLHCLKPDSWIMVTWWKTTLNPLLLKIHSLLSHTTCNVWEAYDDSKAKKNQVVYIRKGKIATQVYFWCNKLLLFSG